MFTVEKILLLSGVLLLAGVVASKFAVRLGLPVLVLFIMVGMLAGEEGLGRIAFDHYPLAHGIGIVALCVILFDGGLRTRRQALASAWKPAGLLATIGVLITSLVTGVAAAWILGLSLPEGILLGSIVGSTDAAAVFAILRSKGLHLDRRVAATLEIESGSNDPMAVFLTITMLEILLGRMSPGAGMLALFAAQMGVGLVAGLVAGWLGVRVINRINMESAGLYPVLTGAFGILSFGVAAALGGSGFLAVYVAGIWIGNQRIVFQRGSLMFHDGLAWLGQMSMFVVLGMLSSPSELLKVAGPGLLVAAVLILVARPLAVMPLLMPFGFSFREMIFISWVGLKGAVPIVLATYPLLFGLPGGEFLFNVVFFVVLVSAVTQGWSLSSLARYLGLRRERGPEPTLSLEITSLREVDADIVGYTLQESARAAGKRVNELALPDGVVVAIIARRELLIPPRGSSMLQAGDHVFVVMRPEVRLLADSIFRSGESAPGKLPVMVEFPLDGGTTAGQLWASYGISLDRPASLTLDQIFQNELGGRIRKGSLLEMGKVTLHVRGLADGRVTSVGVVLLA